MEEYVSTEAEEEEEEEGGMEEYVSTEGENNCLSKFFTDMPIKLSYLPSHRINAIRKSLWVFWSHQTLSSDSVCSSTPVPNLVDLLIKEKIKSALTILEFYAADDDDILFQYWAPVRIDGRCFLTTSDQPFALNKIDRSTLQSYRKHSLDYKFRVDDGASEQNLGLPGRVFRTKLPEYTPDVLFYSNKEYPQRYHAVNCKLHKSFAFPVFKSNGQVVGVLESIFTRYSSAALCYFAAEVIAAFEDVGLKCLAHYCSHFNKFSTEKCDFRDAIDEIKEVFEAVCKTHKIPFAQTWVPCKHCSDVAYGDGYVYPNEEILISLGGELCTLNGDMDDFSFLGNCLKKGQGVPGKAYLSHNSCFCRDVTQLNMFQYPIAHFARHLGLAGSFAICLRSSKTGDQDYVLEFFLPPIESNCEDPIRTLLDPLMVTMRQQFRTFKLSSGKELGDELPVEVLELDMCEKVVPLKLCQSTLSPPRSEPLQSGRDITEADLPYQAINDGRNDNVSAEETGVAIPGSEKEATAVNTTLEKDHNNNEISISFEVIKQHFGMKLEDAAKSLGVSRSTLKRICRVHGMKRWKPPKRKRKNQSLHEPKKHINESVQHGSGTLVQTSLATSSVHTAIDSTLWGQTNSIFTFQQWVGENQLTEALHPPVIEASLEEQNHIVEKLLESQQLSTYEIKIPQLTQQEMKIVDYIFDATESASETLVSYPLEHGTRIVMHSLHAGEWLHSIIINLMVCKLTFEERRRHPDMNCRAWYLPSYVAQQILGEGARVSTMVKKYFGPKRYSGLLSACEKVFIPVNIGSVHWFLCVMEMRQGAVNILDPLPSSNKDREKMVGKIVSFMDKLLAHLHRDEYMRRVVDFPIQRLDWVPQQKNEYDCGVFIIKFMECYKNLQSGVQFKFDSEHARAKIAVDLVLEENNKEKNFVLDRVKRHKPNNESM